MEHKEYNHTNTKQAILRVIREIMLQTVGKDRISIEYTSIPTDGISCRSAAIGTRFATFKVNTEHCKISEI
jgi:hypothetical protein